MVRTDRYKYIVYDKGKRREQLIDMENDPGEMVNLADKPEYKSILNKHRTHMSEWCRLTRDSFQYIPNPA